MTIGPGPITRIRWTSVRLGTRHQLAELPEEMARVVRPGGGFGVVLDRERRHVQAAHALERPVVQVPVRQGHRPNGVGTIAGSPSPPPARVPHPCGSTANPWLWEVTSTRPVTRSRTG